jgi:hypothetical protein
MVYAKVDFDENVLVSGTEGPNIKMYDFTSLNY